MHSPASRPASLDRTGLVQALGAYLIWGLLPLYFVWLGDVGAGEVVASRIAFSLLFLGAVVLVARRGAKLAAAVRDRRVLLALVATAVLISVNWLVYVWAVQNGQVLAASLGYFLNPLINVVLGVIVLKERLTRVQAGAVALAAIGVAVLAAGAGEALWISLTLAVSFALYGLVRKLAAVEALEGLAIETAILTPLALAYLAWLAGQGGLALGQSAGMTALLAGAGLLTAIPLLLFAAAARRLPYATMGVLQYLAPTLQFVLAVAVLGERLTFAHIVCFACIWTGLALYVGGGMWRARRPVPA
ncbi:EamA family transporter RarD [Sphingomonas sp.]